MTALNPSSLVVYSLGSFLLFYNNKFSLDFQALLFLIINLMRHRPRRTLADPTFANEVVRELKRYRDDKQLKGYEVADRLGVSNPTLTKYLQGSLQIGGQVLARAFTELGIVVNYRGKEISARDFPLPIEPQEPPPQQISFVFDQPYLLKETDGRMAITVERKQAATAEVVVTIKVAS
jgi:transcriptional regulator with XRE-family HTH domain